MKTVRIRIRCAEKQGSNGQKFLVYSTILNDATRIPVKFTSAVMDKPKTACVLVCPVTGVHRGRDRKGYDCLWVSAVLFTESALDEGKSVEELREILDVFDDDGNPIDNGGNAETF